MSTLAVLSILLASLFQQAIAESPTAFSVPVDNTWIGYDGSWSPLSIMIGTPAQKVDVFPSTSGQELLAIGLLGCDGTQQCATLRGGLFAANESSTFKADGEYLLGLDVALAPDEQGYYGLETVSFGGEISAADQIVAVVNKTDHWIGSLGLGIDNTTIGAMQAPSFLSSLVTERKIPSLSYGYTAGASYRLKQMPASLTLGGYDVNRFVPNDATFALNSDRQPVLALNTISLSGSGFDHVDVLSNNDKALYTIDSTTPFMWLPDSVATKFEESLGLIYNDTLGVYLYPNSSQYEKLLTSDLSFMFEFADAPGASTSVSLNISGDAFTSHNLTYGFPGLGIADYTSPVPYFPIRKAANATQYTIGRCFMQETYLIVDYDRSNFSISQASFSSDAYINVALVDILPLSQNSSGSAGPTISTSPPKHLSTIAVIGIAIGLVAFATILISILALILLRRRHNIALVAIKNSTFSSTSSPSDIYEKPSDDLIPPSKTALDRFILGSQHGSYKPSELAARERNPDFDRPGGSKGLICEADAATSEITELPTHISVAVELPGSPVPVLLRQNSISKETFNAETVVPLGELSVRDLVLPADYHSHVQSVEPSPVSAGITLEHASPRSTYSNVSSASSTGPSMGGRGARHQEKEQVNWTIDESKTVELEKDETGKLKVKVKNSGGKEGEQETRGVDGKRFSWEGRGSGVRMDADW